MESDTAQVQRRIDDTRRLVARQRQLITNMRDVGHDTLAAERLLRTMLDTLGAFEDDLRLLEDERYTGRH